MKKIYIAAAILILLSLFSSSTKVVASDHHNETNTETNTEINTETNTEINTETNTEINTETSINTNSETGTNSKNEPEREYDSADFTRDYGKTYRINALEEMQVHETKTIRIYESPKTNTSSNKETLLNRESHPDTTASLQKNTLFIRRLFLPVLLLITLIGVFFVLSFACVSVYIKKDGKLYLHVFSMIRRKGSGYVVRFVPKESFTNAKEEYELHFPILFAFLHRYEPVSVIAGCENKEFYVERKLFFSNEI